MSSVPSDVYGAMLQGAPTDPERMQALVASLRQQKLVGQLGIMAGDPSTVAVGKQLDTSADQQTQQLTQDQLKRQEMQDTRDYRASTLGHEQAALAETIRQHNQEHAEKMAALGFTDDGQGGLQRDPAFENTAQGIAHYEIAPPALGSRNNPRNMQLMARAEEIAQGEGRTFDQTLYGAKADGQKYMTGKGAGANLLMAGGTAVQHLGVLSDAVENLNNTNLPIWNRIKNTVKTWAGSPDVTGFEAVKKQVADEVAKFAVANNAAGGTAVFDRKEVEGIADNAAGHKQLQEIMGRWTDLMKGRAQELKQRYENTIPDFPGTNYRRREFETYMDAPTRQALGMPTQAERDAQNGITPTARSGFIVRPIATGEPSGGAATPNNPKSKNTPPDPPLTAADLEPAR